MSSLIEKLNTADRLAGMCRTGEICALRAMEVLTGVGFYDIEISADGRLTAARLDGTRYALQEIVQ